MLRNAKGIDGRGPSEGNSNQKDIRDNGFIADLFPEATVVFADVVGFTAWSSTREPQQVFRLLEAIYAAFDKLATRRKVFKIETIGDCYVAVCGLPDERPDHAQVIAKFAAKCIAVFRRTVRGLEVELGPDTNELGLRVGVNSGPVTSGVLRGDRARYQLFGDTVNTTARMESTGKADMVHLSESTASLLRKAGHEDWLIPRDEEVAAKGKGSLQTYWLALRANSATGSVAGSAQSSDRENDKADVGAYIQPMDKAKMRRLVAWNTDVLLGQLKQVCRSRGKRIPESSKVAGPRLGFKRALPIDEVSEVLELPDREAVVYLDQEVEISYIVIAEIREYVQDIAEMYNNNPFHNFEHASHVTMSVCKLLSRIVSPSSTRRNEMSVSRSSTSLHDYSYGITSDPLTQFACTFSALIHDCDHYGVSNQQLIDEQNALVDQFGSRSVAEQHSIDMSWQHFMSDKFKNFRNVLIPDLDTALRFRQLVVNGVMATDIMDKGLKESRNKRWSKAFAKDIEKEIDEDAHIVRNRRATIVIDHIIQASDVSHTMQHWHVYRKWNERLFLEMAKAYEDGRASKHPVDFWYKGEIGFFDFYIIPLAKKLKECNVFGVSSAEYLDYAEKNRVEWVKRGEEAVRDMMTRLENMKEKADASQSVATSLDTLIEVSTKANDIDPQ